jgi:hypothetical protein
MAICGTGGMRVTDCRGTTDVGGTLAILVVELEVGSACHVSAGFYKAQSPRGITWEQKNLKFYEVEAQHNVFASISTEHFSYF